MTRMYISLDDQTIKVLSLLAREERRNLRQQAAWVLEEELQRRGLLKTKPVLISTLPAGIPNQCEEGTNVTR